MAAEATKKTSVIVVAAGEGKRFGSAKPFALIKGRTVLDRCLEVFDKHEGVFEIILVLRKPEEEKQRIGRFTKISKFVKGGRRRQDSVFMGFQAVDPSFASVVLVHDAARPLVTRDLIDRVIEAASTTGAAVPAIPVSDTIKRVEENRVCHTLERQGLYRCQTPQGFTYEVLKNALAKQNDEEATDEAVFVEKMGHPVCIVDGDPRNIKITIPHDLKIAEVFFEH